MAKRVLVTGASGFVGGSVLLQAPADWDIHTCGRGNLGSSMDGVTHHPLDLTDDQATRALVDVVAPDAILHIAAMANIDEAEQDTDRASAINTTATGRLAELAQAHNARFVFCSTDNVFDGKRGNYEETDWVAPVNYYGRSKVAAEVLVHERSDNAAIARIALVLGAPVMGTGNAFIGKLRENLESGRPVSLPENEVRSPIDVLTVGKCLLELTDSSYRGVLNLAGNTALNRCDMARRLARKMGYNPDLIKPVDSNAMKGRAPRPNDVSLNNALARDVLKTPLRDLDDVLDTILGT